MIRTTVTIADRSYPLAQGHEVTELKRAVVDAIRAGGDLVTFVVYGNRTISALVSAGIALVFEEFEVEPDDRDTGDVHEPFDEFSYLA